MLLVPPNWLPVAPGAWLPVPPNLSGSQFALSSLRCHLNLSAVALGGTRKTGTRAVLLGARVGAREVWEVSFGYFQRVC